MRLQTGIAVDTTGSMKKSDVWGTPNRLDAVRISIALDLVARRIEACETCPLDVVSIVTIEDTPQVITCEHPCSYALYNMIARIYNNQSVILRTARTRFLRTSHRGSS
jgi:hypothetical protein